MVNYRISIFHLYFHYGSNFVYDIWKEDFWGGLLI